MKRKKDLLLIAAIIFAAIIMRSPITGVGPLIGLIKENLELSNAMAGFITTIPLVVFAAASPFVSRLNTKFGTGRLMLSAIVTLSLGILIRSYAGTVGFFTGTVIIGLGIAIINVMIPSISRVYFPLKFGFITSLYVTVMSIFAGISAGVNVPAAKSIGLGWQNTLILWIALPIMAIFVWFPLRKMQLEQKNNAAAQEIRPEQATQKIYKSSVAWWLSFYNGIYALMFYSFVAWLPTMLQSKNISIETAGYFSSAYLFVGILASFLIPMLVVKIRNQKIFVSSLSFMFLVGMCIFYKASSMGLLLVGVIICGFCSAAGISLSMLFIGLRSNGPEEAAKLSGMSQSVGYALAAFAPFLLGKLSDVSGSWSLPISCLVLISVLMVFIGYKAGENRTVFAEKLPRDLQEKYHGSNGGIEELSSSEAYLSSIKEIENIKSSLNDIFESLDDISNRLKTAVECYNEEEKNETGETAILAPSEGE